jgi:hypothetical protein
MTIGLGACTCRPGDACAQCRDAAIRVATAAAAVCDRGKARAVNEIDYEDARSGRVFTVRRGSDGEWHVVDVRHTGAIERGRCRPAASDA